MGQVQDDCPHQIQLYLDAPLSIFEVGDKVRGTGTGFEEATNSGMSKTQIRDLHSYKIVEKNVKLVEVLKKKETSPRLHICAKFKFYYFHKLIQKYY